MPRRNDFGGECLAFLHERRFVLLVVLVVYAAVCILYTTSGMSSSGVVATKSEEEAGQKKVANSDFVKMKKLGGKFPVDKDLLFGSNFPFYVNGDPLDESDLDMVLESLEDVPNLPLKYLVDNFNKTKIWFYGDNEQCARFPSIFDIRFSQKYWQVHVSANDGPIYIWSAYFDDRFANWPEPLRKSPPKVKILAMFRGVHPDLQLYCQIWRRNASQPIIVPVATMKIMNWGTDAEKYNYGSEILAQLLSCHLDDAQDDFKEQVDWRTIVFVSLVSTPCEVATNAVTVAAKPANQPSEKAGLAVCLKGVTYPYRDLSQHLVEWIETNLALGVDTIVLYHFIVHPNMSAVLKHYAATSANVEIVPITLPGFLPNEEATQFLFFKYRFVYTMIMEHVVNNDCFYRNIYKHQWVSLLDLDEIIVPKNDSSLGELVGSLDEETTSTYHISSRYFMGHMKFEEEASLSMILSYNGASTIYFSPTSHNKCLFNTDHVSLVFTHSSLECLDKGSITRGRRTRPRNFCKWHALDTSLAQINHYRDNCTYNIPEEECHRHMSNFTLETTLIDLVKDEVQSRTTDILAKLQLTF